MPGEKITNEIVNLDSFNPALAFRLIGENSLLVQSIGARIIDARNTLLLKESLYSDMKYKALKTLLNEHNITTSKELVKVECFDAEKEYLVAECVLKNVMEEKDILTEVNNNLKVQIRLWELEKQDLKYTT